MVVATNALRERLLAALRQSSSRRVEISDAGGAEGIEVSLTVMCSSFGFVSLGARFATETPGS